MKEYVLLGRKGNITELPLEEWKKMLVGASNFLIAYTKFMSEDHHLVRNYVVKEIINFSKPIEADIIAHELKMPRDRVKTCLEDIYKAHAFLHLDKNGAVEWACPTTLAETPHHLIYPDGKHVNAA